MQNEVNSGPGEYESPYFPPDVPRLGRSRSSRPETRQPTLTRSSGFANCTRYRNYRSREKGREERIGSCWCCWVLTLQKERRRDFDVVGTSNYEEYLLSIEIFVYTDKC